MHNKMLGRHTKALLVRCSSTCSLVETQRFNFQQSLLNSPVPIPKPRDQTGLDCHNVLMIFIAPSGTNDGIHSSTTAHNGDRAPPAFNRTLERVALWSGSFQGFRFLILIMTLQFRLCGRGYYSEIFAR